MFIANEAIQKSANKKYELPAAKRTRFESACIARSSVPSIDGISKRMSIGRLEAFSKRQTQELISFAFCNCRMFGSQARAWFITVQHLFVQPGKRLEGCELPCLHFSSLMCVRIPFTSDWTKHSNVCYARHVRPTWIQGNPPLLSLHLI